MIRCTNVGVNDMQVAQWECKAEMSDYYRFGRTDVSCEGWSQAGDPYVLKGSCGVKYTLLMTDKGKQHHRDRPGRQRRETPIFMPSPQKHDETGEIIVVISLTILIMTCVICVTCCLCGESLSRFPVVTKEKQVMEEDEDEDGNIIRRRKRTTKKKEPKTVYVESLAASPIQHHYHNTDNNQGFFSRYLMGSAWLSQSSYSINNYYSYSNANDDNYNDNYNSTGNNNVSNTYTSTGYGGSESR